MNNLQHYVIRGGVEGRERLRKLSRVMRPSTTALFERLGVKSGMVCLDAGCGGGDVTVELARLVAPGGLVVGAEIDPAKLELARSEARELDICNIEYRLLDVGDFPPDARYDLLYSRFLLTHLPDPARAVEAFYASLKPGGLVVVEDIDCRGLFAFPESRSFHRYSDLYCAAVRMRGGDPNIGPRLPLLLKRAGFVGVDLSVTQPAGIEGEVKFIVPLTMENSADAIAESGLASREELDDLKRELFEFAADPNTVSSLPRVIQSWGRRPA